MGLFNRLNTSIHRIYYKKFSKTKWKIVYFMDAEFLMQPSNYIDRRMWVERGYEKDQLTYLLKNVKKHDFDAFIDIGANFGLYSCVLGANNYISKIHSFECDPRNIYHLYAHIRMNDMIDKVTVHPYAVGDKAGNITFRMALDKSTGHSHVGDATEDYALIYSGDNAEEYNQITVEQKAIDDVLDYNGKNLLFKIDVEGYEKIVLNGMKNTLENNSCLLQIEIVDNGIEQLKYLSSIGYKNTRKIGNDWYFTNTARF